MATKKAKRVRAAAGGVRSIKVKKNVAAEQIEQPTPEQARRVEYQRRELRDEMGRKLATTYRRRPLFETLAARHPEMITPAELSALRMYRTVFDRCERSPTKSCLANAGGHGGLNGFSDLANATPGMLEARRQLARCEAAIGPMLPTMRAAVLHDQAFSEIAIERYGSREVDGRVMPRSGRHREAVRQEFLSGAKQLAQTLQNALNMKGVREIWVEPDVGSSMIVVGACAPHRRYRLWGAWDAVATVREQVSHQWGRDHVFTTAELARDALDQANERCGGRLKRLEDQELAA